MSYDNAQIALRLKGARLIAGHRSAKEFASQLGIPQSTYALHETGQRSLRGPQATRYARELGVNIAWLLEGAGPMFSGDERVSAPNGTKAVDPIEQTLPGARDERAEFLYLIAQLVPTVQRLPLSTGEQWTAQKIAERAGEYADAILAEVAKRERLSRR